MVSQRKYICSFCAKAFSRSEHRTRHERSHTGFKPFQCRICHHAFVRRDLVQRHIKTVHKQLLSTNKDILLRYVDTSVQGPQDVMDILQFTQDTNQPSVSSPPLQEHVLDKLIKLFILYNGSPSPIIATSQPVHTDPHAHLVIHINDLQWINLFNKYIINNNNINNNYPHWQQFSAFNIILYFNRGIEYIVKHNALFAHYILNAYPSLSDMWNFQNSIPTLPLAITYTGMTLHNHTADIPLWRELWQNTTEQHIIAQSLLIHCLIEWSPQHHNILLGVFPHFQHSLQTFLNSLHDPSFNQSDFNGLIVLWASTIQLLSASPDNTVFDSNSSSLYNSIISSKLYNYKHLIQRDIDNLINGNIPQDILTAFPALTYLEAINNTYLNNSNNNKRRTVAGIGTFESMEDLHNLIIKINQCYAQIYNDQLNEELTIVRLQSKTANPKDNDKAKDKDMWKRNLLISLSPQKFKSMIKDYTLIPKTISHWLLLESTWFEFIRNLSSMQYTYQENWFLSIFTQQHPSSSSSSSFDSTKINNNLSICSLPIILLILGPVNQSNLKRFQLFITDVLLIQLKIFAHELNNNNNNNNNNTAKTNKINASLLNPIVQLLLYVWFVIIYKMDGLTTIVYSQLEIDSVNKFMTTYIMNSKKNIDTDKVLEQDLNKILFEKDTYEYLGYHYLLNRTISFIKNELILNKLLSSQDLPNTVKFQIIEFLKLIHHDDNDHDVLQSDHFINHPPSQNDINASAEFDLNDLANANGYMHLESKPTTFNSISTAFNSNGTMTSPIMKTNSISKPNSTRRPSITLAQSPMAISPYSTRRRRSSVISVTEDGKNYLLPPLNFDPIQMDQTVLSSTSHNNSNTTTNTTNETKTNHSNNNNNNNNTNSTNNNTNNNANYSFNGLNNYNFREAIFASPINKKRRASVPIIPPNGSYLTGSNNTVGGNINNNNNPLSPSSHNTNSIIRHPTMHSYVSNGPSTSIMLTGPSVISNNHLFNKSAGGSIPSTNSHTLSHHHNNSINISSFPKSIDHSVNNSGTSTISNSHENSEDLSETTVPLPSPSQLFGI